MLLHAFHREKNLMNILIACSTCRFWIFTDARLFAYAKNNFACTDTGFGKSEEEAGSVGDVIA